MNAIQYGNYNVMLYCETRYETVAMIIWCNSSQSMPTHYYQSTAPLPVLLEELRGEDFLTKVRVCGCQHAVPNEEVIPRRIEQGKSTNQTKVGNAIVGTSQ